ncbi:MAG: hypothetical protein R6V17_00940 [Halanaerobacter sp.]
MRKMSVSVVLLTILLTFGTNSSAQELEIHGELINDLIVEESERRADKKYFTDLGENDILTGHNLNLILEKKLGLKGNLYLETKFLKDYNGEEDIEINRGYLDYYTKRADFKIGKQMIKWGTGYRIKPNDVFNPNDMTGLKPFFDRLAINAVKANYYLPNRSELAFVVTPKAKPREFRDYTLKSISNQTELGVGKQTYAQLMHNPSFTEFKDLLGSQGIDINQDTVQNWISPEIDNVDDKIDERQLGIRYTKRGVKGFDYSLMLFRSRNKTFTVDEEAFAKNLPNEIEEVVGETTTYLKKGMKNEALETIKNHEIPVKYVYPEATRVGFSTIGQIGGQNVWLDLNYSIYDEDKYKNGGFYVIGHDWQFDNGLYVTNQFTLSQKMQEDGDDISTYNFLAEYPILKKHKLKLISLYDIEGDGIFIEPQFDYQINKSSKLQFGFTWLMAEDEGDLVASYGQDRIYSRLKVNF